MIAFCPHCSKEYKAPVLMKVMGRPIPAKTHNCETEKAWKEARKRFVSKR